MLTLRTTRSNKTSHKHGEHFVSVTTGTRGLYHLLIVCRDSCSYSSDLHEVGHEILILVHGTPRTKMASFPTVGRFPTVWSHRVLGLPKNRFQRLTRTLICWESRTPHLYCRVCTLTMLYKASVAVSEWLKACFPFLVCRNLIYCLWAKLFIF